MATKKELLKQMIGHVIDKNDNAAKTTLHNYLSAKIQESIGKVNEATVSKTAASKLKYDELADGIYLLPSESKLLKVSDGGIDLDNLQESIDGGEELEAMEKKIVKFFKDNQKVTAIKGYDGSGILTIALVNQPESRIKVIEQGLQGSGNTCDSTSCDGQGEVFDAYGAKMIKASGADAKAIKRFINSWESACEVYTYKAPTGILLATAEND